MFVWQATALFNSHKYEKNCPKCSNVTMINDILGLVRDDYTVLHLYQPFSYSFLLRIISLVSKRE